MKNLNFTYSLFDSKTLIIDLGCYQIKSGISSSEKPTGIIDNIYS